MDGSAPDAATVDAADAATTPMMAQFLAAKREAGDALVFFRMGDFYELFFDDAVRAAAALDIALTRRGRHKGDDIPMCGVPAHSHEAYLARLIRKGFRVAVCEQVESPDAARKRGAKAVMRREIVRFVTPGTLTEDALLDAGRNNFLGALTILRGGAEAALAFADVSTGEIFVRPTTVGAWRADAAAVALSELVVAEGPPAEWKAALDAAGASLTPQPAALFDCRTAERRLCEQYGVATLDGFGGFSRAEISALGALVAYVVLTQAGRAPALRTPRRIDRAAAMALDAATRASLELFETQGGGRDGSLFAALDRTVTASGARLLASRLAAPLTDPSAIDRRLEAVSALVDDEALRHGLRDALARAPDVARAAGRLALGRGGPRDLGAVRDGIGAARRVGALLDAPRSRLPAELAAALAGLAGDAGLDALEDALSKTLAERLPLLARDGGFVVDGYDAALDAARALAGDSRKVIAALETELRARTGVRTLRIKHNTMLGYFVEAAAKDADALAEEPHRREFIRRQGLAGAVRYTTPDLSDLDARIARAAGEALARELAVYGRLVALVAEAGAALARLADALAAVDVAAALAEAAVDGRWTRPRIDATRAFEIKGGRHPVVERALGAGGRFMPNDCSLATEGEPRLLIVTGPNMAGKSTFLRQNALLAVLAQAGSYVPADFAHIGVVDRVFSRVGAADDLARGRSTFMVEMTETAAILHQASERSLVILDEIGRGTATFDGLSIAWAALEHLHDVCRCRGLFATHYHELTALAGRLPRVANVSMRVREWKGDIVFLHEIGEGPADKSWGVAVARLAGLPLSAVRRAEQLLKAFEAERGAARPLSDLPLFSSADAPPPSPAREPVAEAARALDPDEMTPREALEAIYRLKSLADRA